MQGSTSKRGLAWPWSNKGPQFPLYQSGISSSKLTWLTNWELWKPDGCPSSLEYVPMVRTVKEVSDIDGFLHSLWPEQRKAEEDRHFLCLNEPDVASQANLSVETAMGFWEKDVLPARRKFRFRLGSPAVSSSPEGTTWLREFFDRIGDDGRGKIGFLSVHWYGSNVAEFKEYLENMHQEFKKPVWVAEFACVRMDGRKAGPEEVEAFMRESTALLDGLEYVERYAWFGAMDDPGEWTGKEIALTETVDGQATLRKLGRMYCDL